MREETFGALGEEVTMLENMILLETLRLLSPIDQAVLALEVAGYNQREAGELLGISRTTVWSKSNSAKQRLSDLLVKEN
jgi:DNA-directed RNA polymerase specialized sigma24 family protein